MRREIGWFWEDEKRSLLSLLVGRDWSCFRASSDADMEGCDCIWSADLLRLDFTIRCTSRVMPVALFQRLLATMLHSTPGRGYPLSSRRE